jgi:hydrogenase nickel insertion protein HypA
MHELSIVDGIIRNIEATRRRCRFEKVREIEVSCGKYNCLSEENLQFCFDAVAKSSYLEGAKLKVARREVSYRCSGCGAELSSDAPAGECPACKGAEITPEPNSIYIEKLEVDV